MREKNKDNETPLQLAKKKLAKAKPEYKNVYQSCVDELQKRINQ